MCKTSPRKAYRGEKAREAILNEQDRQFLENLHTLLDKHLDDEAFGITSLAKEMLMSYSSLYARVKSLTGQTPQNFLITYRMNTAMQLLQTGKYTVSEVCYKVELLRWPTSRAASSGSLVFRPVKYNLCHQSPCSATAFSFAVALQHICSVTAAYMQ